MVAIWIAAGSQFLIAACALTYVILRVSDEIRFRRAVDGVERQDGSAIVIPRRQHKPTKQGRRGNYRRIKAQEWLNARMGGGK